MAGDFIEVEGARQNNLKGIDLKLPLGELIVVTGVSGSGKSSLAFDTIYAEGQRRYVETFSPYARQFLDRMDKPQADRIDGIPPAIAIDQTNPVKTSRSTVGTMTELNIGNGRVTINGHRFSSTLHCAECDIHYHDPAPNLFSFNSPIGACETCRGFGRTIGIDYDLVIPDNTKTLAGGAVKPWQTESYSECQDDLMEFAGKRNIPTDIPWRDLTADQRRWVIDGEGSWEDRKWYGCKRFFTWLETKSYKMHVRVLLSRYRTYVPCKACGGARLKPDALLWRVNGKTIHDVVLMPIADCSGFFSDLKLPPPLDEATDLLLDEIRTRLRYLVDVGLGYLTLDRQSRTLSGGEVQRVNLTTALGTSLVNTLYVLDEPSIGLHPRDIRRLISILHRLRDAGNTLLVVEHDPDVIRAADRILDLGPGPGERGGEVVFFGTLPELKKCKRSLTARYLRGSGIPAATGRDKNVAPTSRLKIRGAA